MLLREINLNSWQSFSRKICVAEKILKFLHCIDFTKSFFFFQVLAESRRRDTLRMVESSVKLEMEEKKKSDPDGLLAVNTDDENEEIEYEAWKLRELKRLKRDRDEKEER